MDIGANVGQFSAYLSAFASRVHAFEPFEPVRREMMGRLRQNGIENVVVHPLALGSKDEDLVFYAPPDKNTGTASFVPEHAANTNVPVGKLRVVQGDRYLVENDICDIALVKVDVEGFERQVLEGLSKSLRKCRPIVFMEFSKETKASFTGIDEMMRVVPSGYHVFRVASDQPRAVIFNRPECHLSAFDFEQSGGNLLLVPQEQVAAVSVLAEAE